MAECLATPRSFVLVQLVISPAWPDMTLKVHNREHVSHQCPGLELSPDVLQRNAVTKSPILLHLPTFSNRVQETSTQAVQ